MPGTIGSGGNLSSPAQAEWLACGGGTRSLARAGPSQALFVSRDSDLR